ncbi:MAG: AraC family transcriptional regulator [Spirochaetota bacterium]
MRMPMEEIFPFPMYESRGYPLIVQCIGKSDWRGPYHISRKDSDQYAVEFVHEGRGSLVENGKSFSLKKNDVFILHHGSDHTYSAAQGDVLRKTWITVRGPFLGNLLHLYGMGDVFHVSGCERLAPVFVRLYRAGERAYEAHRHTQRIAFDASLILHEIINFIAQKTRAWENRYDIDIAKMKQYIDDHIGSAISLGDLAELIGCSPSQAVRRFKKDAGMTPYGYVLHRRIEMAKFYLKDTTIPIGRIANTLGFDDEHYFSSFFRKRTGRTPSSVRMRS